MATGVNLETCGTKCRLHRCCNRGSSAAFESRPTFSSMEIQKVILSTACSQMRELTSRQMEGKMGWLSLSLPLAGDLGGPVLMGQGMDNSPGPWVTVWGMATLESG